MIQHYLDISPEVSEAITMKKAVIALESTIISHGMPYPKNVETALELEETVRQNGAIPATIAIMGGRLKVGLDKESINALGRRGREVEKASRRDIAWLVANRMDGATTVAATMYLAALAGIQIFATGGIGGVHRGAEKTMDISADLEELARTNVAVVCAGAKSILDLPKTLEYLETRSVPVIAYKTNEFPAFYCRHSGIFVDMKADDPSQIAHFIKIKRELGIDGGIVIANPISSVDEMSSHVISEAIDKAVAEADSKGIRGKDTTPFLLARIKELTGGESLESNISLVISNAVLASKIAVEMVNENRTIHY